MWSVIELHIQTVDQRPKMFILAQIGPECFVETSLFSRAACFQQLCSFIAWKDKDKMLMQKVLFTSQHFLDRGTNWTLECIADEYEQDNKIVTNFILPVTYLLRIN